MRLIVHGAVEIPVESYETYFYTTKWSIAIQSASLGMQSAQDLLIVTRKLADSTEKQEAIDTAYSDHLENYRNCCSLSWKEQVLEQSKDGPAQLSIPIVLILPSASRIKLKTSKSRKQKRRKKKEENSRPIGTTCRRALGCLIETELAKRKR